LENEGRFEVIDISRDNSNGKAAPTLENLGTRIKNKGFENVVNVLSEIKDLMQIKGDIFDREGNIISLDAGVELMADGAKAFTDGVNAVVDSAMLGGIDINLNSIDLQIQGEGTNFDLIDVGEYFPIEPVRGFTPIIINVSPVTNIHLLLGGSKSELEDKIVFSNM